MLTSSMTIYENYVSLLSNCQPDTKREHFVLLHPVSFRHDEIESHDLIKLNIIFSVVKLRIHNYCTKHMGYDDA